MRTLAILPIKSFDAAKSRLAGALGSGARQALAQAMFSDVLAALRRVAGLEAIAVVTSDERAIAVAEAERVHVVDDTGCEGHSAAALAGIRHAVGDTPLLDPAEVGDLLDRSAAAEVAVAIIPDRHGTGTNGLLLTPPGCFEPSFGPGSRERHAELAQAAGLSWTVEPVPSLLHDVDTPEDLAALGEALASRRGLAPSTRGALSQLQRAVAIEA